MENVLVTEKQYEIHYYEVGHNKEASILSIMNFLEDIFVYQSESTGTGFNYLENNKLGWVIYKWDINIYKYPRYGDKIVVKMYPVSYRKFYVWRKYEIFDINGEKITDAISSWILINTENKKPCKITEELCDIYGLTLENNNAIDMNKVKLPDVIIEEKNFYVRYSDIDTNGHANNVRYLSWSIEAIPKNIIKEYKLRNVKVRYEKETRYGEFIKSSIEIIQDENNIKCLHKITNEVDIVLAVLETTWNKL